jgi:small neutral amino acid transporter SnatA (MarC family)
MEYQEGCPADRVIRERFSLLPELGMTEFLKYFALGFSALLPLINPPGTALELLGIIGVAETKPYKILARKMAVNTTFFLAVIALVGP